MASEGLFSGCWTPATLRTFQVPLRASQLKVKAFYTRVGALADLKISKACRNIYRRIFSGGVIAWHGRNDLRDTTALPFAKLTRIDIPVRSNSRTRVGAVRTHVRFQRCCGQECPRAGVGGSIKMCPGAALGIKGGAFALYSFGANLFDILAVLCVIGPWQTRDGPTFQWSPSLSARSSGATVRMRFSSVSRSGPGALPSNAVRRITSCASGADCSSW